MAKKRTDEPSSIDEPYNESSSTDEPYSTDRQGTTPSKTESSSITSVETVPVSLFTDLQDQQIFTLKQIMGSVSELTNTVRAMQSQNARNAEFNAAIAEVTGEVKAAMKILTSGNPSSNERDYGCSGCCACLAPNCCAFDIILTHVRVLDMQNPLPPALDVEDSTLPLVGGPMEVRIFASINGIGAMIPDLFSYLTLAKLENFPGVWTLVGNRLIRTVPVCIGTEKIIKIEYYGYEVERHPLEQLVAGRDEYGAASVDVTLNCCNDVIYIPLVDIIFTGGGLGGGAIQVKTIAKRRCNKGSQRS
jgi:hypothetical protein